MALNSRFRAIPLLSALVALVSLSLLSVNAAPPPPTAALSDSEPKGYQGLGFYDVKDGGGRWLTNAKVEGDPTLGEPINIVVSGNSDSYILTEHGFQDWSLSIQYAIQPDDITLGGKQLADLGDGNGPQNQTDLLRYDYNQPKLGSGLEIIYGGSHFRYWQQNGPKANSNAWFLAASVEKSLGEGHNIVPNGYDRGRDELVGNATQGGSGNTTISPLTQNAYSVTSKLIQFLPANSSKGINHGIATDGNVAILTVKLLNPTTPPSHTGQPAGSMASVLTFIPLQAKTLIIATTVLSIAFVLLEL